MKQFKVTQQLSKAQKSLIVTSLESSLVMLQSEHLQSSEAAHYITFDVMTIISLLKYKVTVELKRDEFHNFTQDNGIDFPES